MSQPNRIALGPPGDVQELSPFGRRYAVRHRLKTREGEAVSGKARRQIIARKTDPVITYETADQATVDRLDHLMGLDDELTLEVTHLTDTDTYTVLMEPFEKERLLAVAGGLWQGLTIELREV